MASKGEGIFSIDRAHRQREADILKVRHSMNECIGDYALIDGPQEIIVPNTVSNYLIVELHPNGVWADRKP
jgi:hypothetical protein